MKTKNELEVEDPASYQGLMALVEEAEGKEKGLLMREYPVYLKWEKRQEKASNMMFTAASVFFLGMVVCGILTAILPGHVVNLNRISVFRWSLLCLVPGILLSVWGFICHRRCANTERYISDWILIFIFEEVKAIFDRLYPPDEEVHQDLLRNPDALRALVSAEIIELGPLWKIDNLTGVQDMRWRNLKLLATLLRIPEPVSAREVIRRESLAARKDDDKPN